MILVYSGSIQLKLWESFPDGFGRGWVLPAPISPAQPGAENGIWGRAGSCSSVLGVDAPTGSARLLLAEAQGGAGHSSCSQGHPVLLQDWEFCGHSSPCPGLGEVCSGISSDPTQPSPCVCPECQVCVCQPELGKIVQS